MVTHQQQKNAEKKFSKATHEEPNIRWFPCALRFLFVILTRKESRQNGYHHVSITIYHTERSFIYISTSDAMTVYIEELFIDPLKIHSKFFTTTIRK